MRLRPRKVLCARCKKGVHEANKKADKLKSPGASSSEHSRKRHSSTEQLHQQLKLKLPKVYLTKLSSSHPIIKISLGSVGGSEQPSESPLPGAELLSETAATPQIHNEKHSHHRKVKKALRKSKHKEQQADYIVEEDGHHHKSRRNKHKKKRKHRHSLVNEDQSSSTDTYNNENLLTGQIGGEMFDSMEPTKDTGAVWLHKKPFHQDEDSNNPSLKESSPNVPLRKKLSITLVAANNNKDNVESETDSMHCAHFPDLSPRSEGSSSMYEDDSNSNMDDSNSNMDFEKDDDDDDDEGGECSSEGGSDIVDKVSSKKDKKLRPLMMRIKTQHVMECIRSDGHSLAVGDVVWGKILGFPWWPGQINSITVSCRDNEQAVSQMAHVSWFASSTTSHMPCSELYPFLDHFKLRFLKKKRGCYQRAIKLASEVVEEQTSGV